MSLPVPSAQSRQTAKLAQHALVETSTQGGLAFLWMLLYLDLQAISLVTMVALVAHRQAPESVPDAPEGSVQLLVAFLTYEAARWVIRRFDIWSAARHRRAH